MRTEWKVHTQSSVFFCLVVPSALSPVPSVLLLTRYYPVRPMAVPIPVRVFHESGPVGGQEFSLARLADHRLHPIGQMVPVVEQKDSAGTALCDEGDEGDVGFGCVAGATGENQVVGPVVGRLAFAGIDVVEGGSVFGDFDPAISTDRSVLLDQPLTVTVHGATAKIASRTMRIRRGTPAGITWHVVVIRQTFPTASVSGYDQAA